LSVVHVVLAVEDVMNEAVIEEMDGGAMTTVLFAATVTAADVAKFPTLSRATAVRAWEPLATVAVFQLIV
jgi:hypothetical protein